jgi:hypothetical protein
MSGCRSLEIQTKLPHVIKRRRKIQATGVSEVISSIPNLVKAALERIKAGKAKR